MKPGFPSQSEYISRLRYYVIAGCNTCSKSLKSTSMDS